MPYRTVMLVAGPAAFSTRDVWDGYRDALSAEGVHVIPYPTFSMLRMLSAEVIGNDIVGKALDVRNGVDVVVFIDGMYFQGERAWVPETIRRAGKPTVLISTDDPYDPVKHADVLYTHRFSNEIHSAAAGAFYLPLGSTPPADPEESDEDPELSDAYDVAFIGTLFEDRWPLIRKLAYYCQEQQRRLFLAGNMVVDVDELEPLEFVTVRKQTVRPAEKWDVYSRSKLVLNVFRATDQPASSPSPRVFEVTAHGRAALLSGVRRTEVTRIYGDAVYQFEDFGSLKRQMELALRNEQDRRSRVERAQQITLSGHLYEHRARKLLATLRKTQLADGESLPEDRMAWIFGCGRTGSTWLTEMLDDVPGLRSWNEPYFGRLFRHLHDRPDERKRPSAFFFGGFHRTWKEGIRRLFFDMVRQRFPEYGRSSLVVKEVNTPEFFPLLRSVFPASQYILLIRDPFDVLDSYIDMSKPGSWSKHFSSPAGGPDEKSIRRSAAHIHEALSTAFDSYLEYPESQRLMVRYEDLLEDPARWLTACARLVSLDVTSETAERIVEKHRFERHQETGELAFRRYGQTGIWQRSGNFNPAMTALAEEILGGLRKRLGYESPPERRAVDAQGMLDA